MQPTLGMTCTLVRVTETSDEGDLERLDDRTTGVPCAVFPKTWTESSGRTVVDSETSDAFFGPDVDLEAVDRVEVGDDLFELAGRPVVWTDPRTGEPSYTQATLKRSGRAA